jgi:hypothetical protein
MLRTISNDPWYVTNQTLQNDFDIPFVTEVVRIKANTKIAAMSRVIILLKLSSTPQVDRRLKRVWQDDLAQKQHSSEPSMDGACFTKFPYPSFITLSILRRL